MWKHLSHPNILPLLGITITPLQLISEWMPGGDLPGYIEERSDADRLRLVSAPGCGYPTLTSVARYLTPLRGFATSTPVMWFMGTSREYVVVLTLVSPLY